MGSCRDDFLCPKVLNTGPTGGLQRVIGYFEIISKYLIVSLCGKNVHSVYQILEGIHDPPPQDVKIHYHKLGFLFFFFN